MFEFQGHSGEPLRFPSKFVYGHSRCSSLRISQNLSSARHIYEVTEVWISRSFGWAPAISVKIGIRTYYILLITNIIKVKLGPPYFSSYGVTKLRNFKVIRRAPPIFVKICMRTHYMLLITNIVKAKLGPHYFKSYWRLKLTEIQTSLTFEIVRAELSFYDIRN